MTHLCFEVLLAIDFNNFTVYSPMQYWREVIMDEVYRDNLMAMIESNPSSAPNFGLSGAIKRRRIPSLHRKSMARDDYKVFFSFT